MPPWDLNQGTTTAGKEELRTNVAHLKSPGATFNLLITSFLNGQKNIETHHADDRPGLIIKTISKERKREPGRCSDFVRNSVPVKTPIVWKEIRTGTFPK